MSQNLVEAMADLKEDSVLAIVKALKDQETPALAIIKALQDAMSIVGKRFETKEYFLPELIMSAEIFNRASGLIQDELSKSEVPKHGTFVIGTVFGDVHDIGKNIASTVLACNGFNVIDLGIDVSAEKFIEAIKERKPEIVGMSCMLTTAFDHMKEVVLAITKAGLRKSTRIVIGGSMVNETVREYVRADAFCTGAHYAAELSTRILGLK